MSASYMNERWFGLLVEAVAKHPRGKAGVADQLGDGISRPMVSLVISGQYKTPARIAKRVLAVFDRYPCPYLGIEIEAEHCREVNAGPVPTWDPAALDQRRRCQSCPHHPEGGAK